MLKNHLTKGLRRKNFIQNNFRYVLALIVFTGVFAGTFQIQELKAWNEKELHKISRVEHEDILLNGQKAVLTTENGVSSIRVQLERHIPLPFINDFRKDRRIVEAIINL